MIIPQHKHANCCRPLRWAVMSTVVLSMLAVAPTSHAHPSTERFIPIGQSPGMSGKYTHTGRISRVDERTHTLTVETDDGGSYQARLQPQTSIWLDRSKSRRATRDGDFADCRRGRRVEIKYVDDDRDRTTVDWIKIESR